ncbi:MAG: hypothetical protein H6742_18340 [Alphaproteobacteria bacterium]|nr:hypothetical protein [Alphaproteobacteria bacterium]
MAAALKRAGLLTIQGMHVADPESGKPRETDVLGLRERKHGALKLQVVANIECKSSRKHPWLIFTHRTSKADRVLPRAAMLASRPAEAALFCHGEGFSTDRVLQYSPMLTFGPRLGFGGRQAFFDGNQDQFYGAIRGVMSSSAGWVNSSNGNEGAQAESKALIKGPLTVVVPVMVVDCELFSATWCEDSEQVRIEREQWLPIRWSGARDDALFRMAWVVEAGALDEWLPHLINGMDDILATLSIGTERLLQCRGRRSLGPLRSHGLDTKGAPAWLKRFIAHE